MKIIVFGIISIILILGILSSRQRNEKDFASKIEINIPTDNAVNKIEVRKVNFYILTIAHVDCIDFEYCFNSSKEIYVFELPDTISLFMNIINSLQRDTADDDSKYTPDVRAKILIFRNNNKIDTLCMDMGRIMLNDERYIFDERLLKLVDNLGKSKKRKAKSTKLKY